MKCNKTHLCSFSLVALVALRVTVGWHFFSEGVKHLAEPGYAEGFLKQAKGPIAAWYQSPLPDFHGWTVIMLQPAEDTRAADAEKAKREAEKNPVKKPEAAPPKEDENDPKVIEAKKEAAYLLQASHDWVEKAATDWLGTEAKIAAHFGFTDAQKEQVKDLHKAYRDRLYKALSAYEEDIRAFRHNEDRLTKLRNNPASKDVPNMKTRVETLQKDPYGEKGSDLGSDKDSKPNAKPPVWQADAKAVEATYINAIENLATEEQHKAHKDLPVERTAVQKQETFITYSLMAIGACLMVGFLTPLASLGGAVFLLSVMATQPFWVPGTMNPVAYYQAVEIVALLFLALSGAGRYGGLDFFLARLLGRCCASKKAT